ncbi:hypothetical protein L5515_007758 [Caenorhabditis briggsae]|uniref:Uncharacterized protein n=1 Tax=Caenorhabditis briggsae TaxID=6238 RepID=A0AAE9F559_CAEBR|nr:hypothetical protein L3Y34_007914 [Caenorhabditis briggsae]UMM34884.1 hypothetical protein L5515_007758 [Caenorhabditis briggsae]
MGVSENGEDSGDSTLRRSSRKRIPKRDDDFDYDFDYYRNENPSTSAFPVQCDFPPESVVETPKIKKSRAPKRAKYSQLAEMTENNNANEDEQDNSLDFSMILEERKIDPVQEKALLDSLIKLNPSDLINMDVSDIIDVHCENLKRRLEGITQLYLISRSSTPPPTIVSPSSYIEIDSEFCSFIESEELAVKMVVEELVETVSLSNQ